MANDDVTSDRDGAVRVDPRPARTRQALMDAVPLVLDGGAPPTVSAIVRAAGVSRSVFYTHFDGLDHLAVTILSEAFADIGRDDSALRREGQVSGRVAARRAQERLVEHILDRRPLYSALLTLPIGTTAWNAVVEAYAAQVRVAMALIPEIPDEVHVDAAAVFTASGSLGLVLHWLRQSDPMPPERLVDQLLLVIPAWLAAP